MFKVGYVPYSQDLQHPADRRRLAAWAKGKKTVLNLVDPTKSDILVLSNAANFGHWLKLAKQPVILDLVDGYLGQNPSFLEDFARNVVRSIKGTSNFKWITYTRHLAYACKKSDAIVVASQEQKDLLQVYNKNIYVVLDDHTEVAEAVARYSTSNASPKRDAIFWEGFGYTLKHFKFISKELDGFLDETGWEMNLVTVKEFARWGGYIGKIKTEKLVKKLFPLSWTSIRIVPWSLQNLATCAHISRFGIIPIDPSDKFAMMKSENKLMSMWSLGLPVLFSNIPSYAKLASRTSSESICIKPSEWRTKLDFFSSNPNMLEDIQAAGQSYVKSTHTNQMLIDCWNSLLLDTRAKGSKR